MTDWIRRQFGTPRGAIRLLLAHAESLVGRLDRFALRPDMPVRRTVFVCQGNICRSAYAERIAIKSGLPAASVGLSTTTGVASPVEAIAAAARAGVDMQAHRALNWDDLEIRNGDLFIAMEIRQAHEILRRLGGRDDVQVALLGMWATPRVPHLHDPFSLSDQYFDTCFSRIDRATRQLHKALSASPSGRPAS